MASELRMADNETGEKHISNHGATDMSRNPKRGQIDSKSSSIPTYQAQR